MANSVLYGICQAAIVSLGFSPGLGFIHTGKMLSFVYDIADLYKLETSVPAAFSVIGGSYADLEREVRTACRRWIRVARVPVSYTHLDVYKRQANKSAGWMPRH